MATCPDCGTNVGLRDRVTHAGKCASCHSRDREATRLAGAARNEKREQARRQYRELLSTAVNLKGSATVLVQQLPQLAMDAELEEKEKRKLQVEALQKCADNVLADDILTEDEEQQFTSIAGALGITQSDLETEYRDILHRMVVARVNDGRMPVLSSPRLLARRGENVHLETNASLIKEVIDREYRGAYGGFSFRVTKGVRYHTGRTRGKLVVTGSHTETADAGVLSVSSKRVVFMGSKSTIDVPYGKLANLEVFSDGLRLSVSNRKTSPLFKLENGDVVAAVLNAAVQRSE